MKKFLVAILAFSLVLSMAACGKADADKDNSSITSSAQDQNKPSLNVAGSLKILENVWNALDEDSKFFCVGGNMNAGTAVEGKPGDFGVDKPDEVDNSLGFPQASISLIDEAANLIHSMNANTFTMAAYHLRDKANLDTAVKAIDDNLADRQWMCGFPEFLTIITIDGEYVISIFGATDLVSNVKNQIITSYPDAVVVLSKDMMQEY